MASRRDIGRALLSEPSPFGGGLGCINGILISLGVPAFIVTLGALVSIRGLAFVYSHGHAIPMGNEMFLWLGRGDLFGVNMPFILAVFVTLAGHSL